MKTLLIVLVISVFTFFVGYQFGIKKPLKTAKDMTSVEKPVSQSNALMKLSQEEYKKYQQLKDNKAKYDMANNILGKMLVIFLADLGLRLEEKPFDLIKLAQQQEKKKAEAIALKTEEEKVAKNESAYVYEDKDVRMKKKMSRIKKWKQPGSKLHPGAVPEIPPGTELNDGFVVGEKEGFDHFKRFEPELFKGATAMDRSEFRSRFANSVYWFQRVGAFRTRQKCAAIQQMQSELGLKITNPKKCVADLEMVHKELWGED